MCDTIQDQGKIFVDEIMHVLDTAIQWADKRERLLFINGLSCFVSERIEYFDGQIGCSFSIMDFLEKTLHIHDMLDCFSFKEKQEIEYDTLMACCRGFANKIHHQKNDVPNTEQVLHDENVRLKELAKANEREIEQLKKENGNLRQEMALILKTPK